jgi:hypothetical protein
VSSEVERWKQEGERSSTSTCTSHQLERPVGPTDSLRRLLKTRPASSSKRNDSERLVLTFLSTSFESTFPPPRRLEDHAEDRTGTSGARYTFWPSTTAYGGVDLEVPPFVGSTQRSTFVGSSEAGRCGFIV